MSGTNHNPDATPLVADPIVRACARHDLRQGADPLEVATLLEVCVEDLYDLLELVAPQ